MDQKIKEEAEANAIAKGRIACAEKDIEIANKRLQTERDTINKNRRELELIRNDIIEQRSDLENQKQGNIFFSNLGPKDSDANMLDMPLPEFNNIDDVEGSAFDNEENKRIAIFERNEEKTPFISDRDIPDNLSVDSQGQLKKSESFLGLNDSSISIVIEKQGTQLESEKDAQIDELSKLYQQADRNLAQEKEDHLKSIHQLKEYKQKIISLESSNASKQHDYTGKFCLCKQFRAIGVQKSLRYDKQVIIPWILLLCLSAYVSPILVIPILSGFGLIHVL